MLFRNKVTTSKSAKAWSFFWPSPKVELLVWLGITILYFLRALYLDADAAPWGVATYQPIDEGVYGDLALNVINFGSINPNDYYQGLYQYQMQAHTISGLFTNMVVLLFLRLLGDNYYGFRMGSAVIGYLILLFFYLTLKEMAKKAAHKADSKGSGSPSVAVGLAWDAAGKRRCLAAFACTFILLFSFVFYDACRFVEPSIYRLFFVQAIIYCFVKESFSIRLKAFFIGFLWICSVFFVYITNVFVGLPILAYLIFLLMRHRMKEAREYLLYGLLGLLSAYALAIVYYSVMWGTSPLANLISGVLIFQQQGYNNGNYQIAYIGLLQNCRAFFVSNIVLYDLPLVPILFLGLPVLAKSVFRESNVDAFFIFFVVVGLLLQTLVSQDFATRKTLVVFPSVLLLVYMCINRFQMVHIEDKRKRLLSFIFCLLVVALVLYVFLFRMLFADGTVMTCLDYSETDVAFMNVVACITAVIAVLVFAGRAMGSVRLCNLCVGVSIGCCFIVNGYFLIQYHMGPYTYSEKQVMIQLGDEFGSSVVTGDYICGFTLYNDIHPLVNDSQTIEGYLKKDSSLYYFDYAGETTSVINPKDLVQGLQTTRTFRRAYVSFGYSQDVSMYHWAFSGLGDSDGS